MVKCLDFEELLTGGVFEGIWPIKLYLLKSLFFNKHITIFFPNNII